MLVNANIASTNNNNNNNNSTLSRIPSKPTQGEEFTVRVLTLNCWGLWLGARKRGQRIAGIVRYLQENNYDIVFLQEVWVTSDFELIRNETSNIYRFAHLFRSGSVLGSSGIVILCKWLPKVIHFEPYSLNGSPFYPWHGDWFAGKGIAYSRVDFDGLSLHLFSTHTHAYYKENEPVQDQYSVHRVCQSYQLARFITFIRDTACNRKSDGKDLLIVAGDMNSTSSELPYKILTTMAGLTDCFKASRYSSQTSNIIHRHKLMNYRRRLSCVGGSSGGNSSGSSLNNNSGTVSGFLQNKLGDNVLLETLEAYRNRIASVFFDSDTDDEDITYCHPRNSFTPNGIDGKYANKFAAKSESQQELSKSEKKAGDDNNSSHSCNLDTNSLGQRSSSRQTPTSSEISKTTRKRSKNSPMKRIDFILCSLLTHGHCVVDRIATETSDLGMSLSDHEPVMVELKICDVSHDLMDKNRIASSEKVGQQNNKRDSVDNIRPLASVVNSKVSISDANHIEETTDQWVQEKTPVNITYQDCNIQVMEETQELLMQYCQYNRSSKTQLFYLMLFIFVVTLPSTTYYALSNELIPIYTIVFMWLASSFLFAIGLLVGFLSYRFEQGAIEAILNDITCKISVAKDLLSSEKIHSISR